MSQSYEGDRGQETIHKGEMIGTVSKIIDIGMESVESSLEHSLTFDLTFEASTTPTVEQAVAQSMKAICYCVLVMVHNNANTTTAARRNAHCGQP